MVEQFDISTLNWVKGEIDETLKQARLALEAFAENSNDEVQAGFCATYLHQVGGTLQMVEVEGASRLAAEMEALLEAMRQQAERRTEGSFEVLMRALLQLPNYLESLLSGIPDSSIILLPLINELRRARGLATLEEIDLFNPDLRVMPPGATSADLPNLGELAKDARRYYQAALLNLLRGREQANSLKAMGLVFAKLTRGASRPAVRQWLWVVSGYVAALREGAISLDAVTKQLLGKNDQVIKRLATDSEDGLAEDELAALVRAHLFQIAKCGGHGEQVRALCEAFCLDRLKPSAPILALARESLSGLDAEVRKTVAANIMEDIEQVKDALDLLVRSGQRRVDGLQPLAERLGHIASTLDLLRHEDLHNALKEQSVGILKLVNDGVEPDDHRLMDIAGVVLAVESALGEWGGHHAMEQVDDASEQVSGTESSLQGEAEHRRVVRQVMKEAKADLLKVRDDINTYLAAPQDKSVLVDAPRWLARIAGSLSLLSYKRAGGILKACQRYIEEQLAKAGSLPEEGELDAMADAMMSVEYYLEAFIENRVHPASVLEVGERAVERLGYPVGVVQETVSPARAPSPTVVPETSSEATLQDPNPAVSTITPPPSVELRAMPTRETEPQAPAEPAPPAQAVPGDDVDEAIVEVFQEEAEEAFADIARLLPMWESNPGDESSLKDLRRCFHTLKGSGRLIGAVDLGEFAWAFENMLNRVIDHTASPSAAMFDLLAQSREALPQLLEHFRGGAQPSMDVAMLLDAAEAMSNPNGPGQRGQAPADTVSASEEARSVAAGAPAMDPVLLEIYSKETEEHLGELARFIADCRGGNDCLVNDSVVRTLHTLQGSSRMADVPQVAETSGILEKYGRILETCRIPIDQEGIRILEQTVTFVRAMLDHLRDTGNPMPDVTGLAEHARSLHDKAKVLEEQALAQLAVAEVDSTSETEPAQDDLPASFAGETPPSEPLQRGSVEPAEPIEESDPELLGIFLEEGTDLLNASEESLQEWAEDRTNLLPVQGLQRQLHTLKGSARMAGVKAIGDLSHSLESTFEHLVDGRLSCSDEMIRVVEAAHDRLVEMVEQVRRGEPVGAADDLIARIHALSAAPSLQGEEAALTLGEDATPEDFSNFGRAVLTAIADDLRSWIRASDNTELLDGLRARQAALTKAADFAAAAEVRELSQQLEALLTNVADGHVPLSDRLYSLLHLAYERLGILLDRLRDEADSPGAGDLITSIVELMAGPAEEEVISAEEIPGIEVSEEPFAAEPAAPAEEATPLSEEETAPTQTPVSPVESRALSDEESAQNRRHAGRIQHELVRVRSDLLDNMVNVAGEASIYRSRVEQQIGSFGANLDELDQVLERLREQMRLFHIEAEAQIQSRYEDAASKEYEDFDPLEFDRFTNMQQLSRSMMESFNDLGSVQDMLMNLTRDAETLLLQQSRVNTELQEGLMRTRMVPLVENAPRLRRIVRQVSAELGKEAELRFYGAEVEVDRNVVQRIMAPLEHMLRNAISHGIEMPDVRRAAGKPAAGSIAIEQFREGTEVVIRVSDDGAGIDLAAVRRKAVERGLMAEGADLSDEQIVQFILESGFSTAASVTQVSGRGVGLDVVNSEIRQLGGTLAIEAEQGKGTAFTIRLPLSLSISRALLVSVGEDVYAIPLLSIQGLVRIDRDELATLYEDEQPKYRWLEHDYDLVDLAAVLGTMRGMAPPRGMVNTETKRPLLLAQSGGHRVALAVDGFSGSREIVVKPLGRQLTELRALSGATILGDGSVVLILELPAIIRMGLAKRGELPTIGAEVQEQVLPIVMVVDDSITVRKVTARLLERNNMRAITARDGVEALGLLEETVPDVMLLDIEMPRMDGYELATHIRNEARFRHVPIIMITSRSGEKHRQRALQLGVDRYLGKPFQERELLDNIDQLISEGRAAGGGAA